MDIIISAFLFGLAFIALQTEVTPLWLDWPFVALCICLALARYTLSNEKWCRDLRDRLAAERSAQPYRALMLPLLRRVTRWRRPPVAGPDTGWLDFHARDAKAATRTAYTWFGWTLFDFAMLCAVMYPFIFLLVQWAFGGKGRFGEFVAMPQWSHWATPVAVLFALGGALRFVPSLRRHTIQWSAKGPDVIHLQHFTKPAVIAVLSAAFFWITGKSISFEFAIASTLALFCVTFLPGIVVSTYVLIGTLAFIVTAVSISGIIILYGMLTVPVFVAALIKRGHASLACVGYVIFAAGSVFIVSFFSLPLQTPSGERLGVLLFLGLFPLLNGVFDFLSYGVTLGLWRVGLRRGGIAPWVLGFADIVAALFLFTALGAALILSVAVMNRLAGVHILPLDPIFADLRSKPIADQLWLASAQAQYMWLYAMLFSTLVPTLIHAGLSCLSLAQWAPAGLRRRYVGWIDRRDESPWAEIGVTVGLGLTWFLSFMLPLVALCGLLWLVQGAAPLVGETYLQVFELLARWLGQIDSIGPGYIPQGWGSPVEV